MLGEHLQFTNPPYRMAIINFFLLFVFVISLLLSKAIFPNKSIKPSLILLALSVLPILSILRPGTYESGDLTINVVKLASFYTNLSEGNILPRWSGDLNATYGYPNFIFAYPLPYYAASFFHFLGFSYLVSLKLLLISSFMGSGFVMFFFLKSKLDNNASLLGSILYLYSPYHLIDLHFRVDIGETLAFVFMPLCLLLIHKSLVSAKFLWKFLAGLSICALIISHQAVSLLFFPVLLGYTFISVKKYNLRSIFDGFMPAILGLLYSAFYWIPVLLESKYTQQINMIKNQIVFPEIWELIFSPYRYGFLFQGPMGELSPVIGYANLLIILALIYYAVKKEIHLILIFLGIFILFYLFLMTEYSSFIWSNLSLLRKIEFPFRILSVLIFLISVSGAFIYEKIQKKTFIVTLILLAVGTSLLNWGNRRNIPEITEAQILANLPLSTSQGEGLFPAAPIYVNANNVWRDKIPNSHIEPVSGDFDILDINRSQTTHEYDLITHTESVLRENTYYFPGWKLRVDNESTKIDFANPDNPGIIHFNLLPGTHHVELNFTDTPVRSYSFILALTSLLLTGVLLILLPTAASASAKTAASASAET